MPETKKPNDFAKFDRAVPGPLSDDILSRIVTSEPSGPVTPVMTPGVETIPVAPGQPALSGQGAMTKDEQAQAAWRASVLGETEQRLKNLPPVPPVFTGRVASVVPSQFGEPAAELIVRDGADALHVECFRLLRRLVAGNAIPPGSFDPKALFSLMSRLQAAIEPRLVPPVVTG